MTTNAEEKPCEACAGDGFVEVACAINARLDLGGGKQECEACAGSGRIAVAGQRPAKGGGGK